MTTLDECITAKESLHLDKIDVLPQDNSKQLDEPQQEASSYPDDNMPIKSKGGYQLDFDNLDAINPFQSSNMMALTPARPAAENPTTHQAEAQSTKPEHVSEESTKTEPTLDETLPFTPSVENSLVDLSTNISSADSSGIVVVRIPDVDSWTATPDEKQPAKMPSSVDQDKASGSFVEDAPLPERGSYNLDFDNMEEINPFQTGGSKIQNSPSLVRKVPDNSQSAEEPQVKKNKCADGVDVPEEVQESLVQPEVKPEAAVAVSSDAARPQPAETQPAAAPSKEGPIKLEFNFDDGIEVKKKPLPKKFVKRPSGAKSKEGKPPSDVNPPKETPLKPDASDVADVPLPKNSYTFDFDKADDPNFNPFGTTTSINNSPKCSRKSSPVLMKAATPEQADQPEEKQAPSPACVGENVPVTELNPGAVSEHKAASDHDEARQPEGDQLVQSLPEPSDLCQPEQKSQSGMLDNEEFVPGATFMANDFDGQIDYLEQFGSSNFKESALRKQSLYLKFDPLLRESPKKSAGPAAQPPVPHPAAFASRLETPQMIEKEGTNRPLKNDFKLLDAAAPTRPVLESLIPPFPQPANTEDAIIEVLKYSQKDMDAAIAKVQAETKEKEEQWNAKYKKLLEDGQELRKIIAEFELEIAKMMGKFIYTLCITTANDSRYPQPPAYELVQALAPWKSYPLISLSERLKSSMDRSKDRGSYIN
uniref:transforming acidic coiled-coil-containing protein 3-like n=1 Tax=Monopterus albus TaxID=43700 RepID=UPI0009B325EF|nr:transforming acidic coiled-coil-containing protein 3-like [Monopterus albus]